MKKVYIAGDMLKKGSQLLRAMERDAISKIEGVELYTPQDQEDINDKTKNPTAEAIFKKDTDAILESDIIVADVDNDSVGTTCEMGQIWGINYMIRRLKEIVENAETTVDVYAGVMRLLAEIPEKEVLWQVTDVREVGQTESGIRRSYSLNQYLVGCMLDMAGENKDFDEIVNEIEKRVEEQK